MDFWLDELFVIGFVKKVQIDQYHALIALFFNGSHSQQLIIRDQVSSDFFIVSGPLS